MSTTTLRTAEELFNLPRDQRWYELLKGELKMMSPRGGEHGMVIYRITGLL